MNDRLVWIDCEMTGLDLHKDALIEIAVLVTDGELNIIDEGIDFVVSGGRWWFLECNPTGQLDAQFNVWGVKAAAGCWKGEWIYADKHGDAEGNVHRMKDSLSALHAVSKTLATTLEMVENHGAATGPHAK